MALAALGTTQQNADRYTDLGTRHDKVHGSWLARAPAENRTTIDLAGGSLYHSVALRRYDCRMRQWTAVRAVEPLALWRLTFEQPMKLAAWLAAPQAAPWDIALSVQPRRTRS